MKKKNQHKNKKALVDLSDSTDGWGDCLTNPADVRQYGKFPQVRPGWSGH